MNMLRSHGQMGGAGGIAQNKRMTMQSGGPAAGWGSFRDSTMVDSQLTIPPPGYEGSLLHQARCVHRGWIVQTISATPMMMMMMKLML